MNTARILSFILLPFLAFAQAPAPYPVLVDSQRATVPALEVFQANAITFRASFKSGNVSNGIVTESPFMYWQPFGATNATVVTANWSIVSAPSGVVDFAFTPGDLNFAAGTYSYQVGLEQSGGPQVIKQGSFTIRPSQASIGAEPIAFATTNVNWGLINWTGVPDFEYQTNTIAQVATLNASIATASNALSGQINTASNALHTQIQAVNDASKWSQFQATQTVNMANNSITNAGNVQAVSINGDGAAISIPHIHGTLAGNIYIHIRNGTTNTIAKGTPVYVIGNVGVGDRKLVAPAQSGDPTKMPAIALAEANLTANADGDGVILGEIRTYNTVTNSWTINTELYVAPLGGLTATVPTNGLVQSVGQVSRTNSVNGIIVAQIQGAVLPKEAFLASTTTFVAVESDPIFAAASNSINTRITAVETGKVDLTVYTPATQALWTAIGNIVSAENALTNVTASGRITATRTNSTIALTFDASGLATGTPIYSVSGLATGTPLYVESDPIWSAASNLYATTAGVAAAYYPIGNPSNFITTAALAGYVTGDVIRVEADPVYAAASNTIFTRIIAVEGYTNLAASALSSSVWASADSTTNYASRVAFVSVSNTVTALGTNVEARLASNVWAAADSTTNYASRIAFTSFTNSYATADATTNYALRTTFVAATNALDNKFTNFLQLAGGTVVGDLRVSRSTTASTALVLTNSGSISTGLRIDLPTSSTFLDFNAAGDKYTFTDTTANFHGNTITNAIVAGYLTVTGAATTYVNTTNLPAGIVTTNNLSTIAGSGLGVTSNRLVVTNVAGMFESLTGSRFVLGSGSFDQIAATATGAFTAGKFDRIEFMGIGENSHGASIHGHQQAPDNLTASGVIASNAYGAAQRGHWRFDTQTSIGQGSSAASQHGEFWGEIRIGENSYGASQHGFLNGYLNIGDNAHGAMQRGSFFSGTSRRAFIGDNAFGALQQGRFLGRANLSSVGGIQMGFLDESGVASNLAVGAIQIMADSGTYITTEGAVGSILLGPGTNNVAYSVRAAGGFFGNAAGLTNFPSSILTVSAGNAAYWRITTAPTGATSSGSSGQMAVSGTNLYIYSPNALGVGTARWLRVNAEANW